MRSALDAMSVSLCDLPEDDYGKSSLGKLAAPSQIRTIPSSESLGEG